MFMGLKEIGQNLSFLEKLHLIWLHNLNLEWRDGSSWRFNFFNEELLVSFKWSELETGKPWFKEIQDGFNAEKLIRAIDENLEKDEDLKAIHERYLKDQAKGKVI
jgi:NADPH:quinone reductase-like Zn-dependent oxidoreductase